MGIVPGHRSDSKDKGRVKKATPESAEKAVRDIRRTTHKQSSTEEKLLMVLEGLRSEGTSPRYTGASQVSVTSDLELIINTRLWCRYR